MKRLILGLCACALLACGGKSSGVTTPETAAVAGYPATRWIPGTASYAITAHTVREGQQALRDLIDTFGVLGDVTVADASEALTELLLVDPLSLDALAQIGIDIDGGFAIYSEAINPTVAVHLSSAQQFQGFIESQARLRVQSVVVDGVELFTVPVSRGLRISWAVADDWLFVHFAVMSDDGQTWFQQSRHPGKPTWTGELAAGANVVGFIDVGRFLADAQARIPPVAQCVGQLQLGTGIGKASIALTNDAQHASARMALDIGPLAPRLAAIALPVPEGWAAATAQVPLAAQWNLDLEAIRQRAEPCLALFDADLRDLAEVGVRAGRAYLRTWNPDAREGTGAVSLDLVHKDFLAAQLDQIPLRSTLERNRTFGPYAGKSIAIPMFLTIDYVLQDRLALAAVGEGLLLQLVGRGGTAPSALAEIAVQPQGLSVDSWASLFELAELDHPKRIAERLQSWRDARVKLTIEGTRLVLAADGTRR